jgi:hypothetical protein
MDTQQVAWSHDNPDETPACWPAEDNRFVLGWDLSTAGAKDEIKLHPQLKAEADAPLEQIVIPEVDLSHGWNDERYARVSGEYVLVSGERQHRDLPSRHGRESRRILRLADGDRR